MNRIPKVNNLNRGFFPLVIVAVLSFLFAARLSAAERQTLKGHLPTSMVAASRVTTIPAPERMSLTIAMPLQNRDVLTNLLDELYDPTSTNYHHYLTAPEFAERFGPTEKDYQAVMEFARTNGLTIKGTYPNRTLLHVEGSRTDIERIFHVNIGMYQHPTEARTFFAPDVEPSVDLAVPILHVDGLDNFFVPKPDLRVMPVPKKPALNEGSGPSGTFWGYDFRNAYAPGTALNGAGQKLALYELEGYLTSDITTYESQSGLPNVPIQNIAVDGFSFAPNNTDTNGVDEVCLDIEVALAMAPGLDSVLVYGGTGGTFTLQNDILNQIATDNQAQQISSSWAMTPNAATEQIFQQYAMQGQSFFRSSGDNLAYTNTVPGGRDDPYITVVGGTELSTDANTNWQSESVWNFNGSGSGGGISTTYFLPSYQSKVSMASNQGSTIYRNIPDVAMVGNNLYVIARGGQVNFLAGTSASAPLWAAFMSLVNQQAAALGRPRVGFLNPILYSLGEGNFSGNAYHDITTGNNTSAGSPSKFFAVAGYDLCTGWGSPNGTNMINALALFGSATWVDFNFTGTPERGQFDLPYKTLSGAVTAVPNNGVIVIKPGTSSEKMTISKPMKIISAGGSATIGH